MEWQGNLLVEGFYTDLSDVFALTEIGIENGALVKERRDESGEDVEAVKDMFRTPDVYGYFVTSYNPLKQFMLSLNGTYTGSMLVEHHAGYIEANRTERTAGFMDLNLKAAYDFSLYSHIKLSY